MRAPTCVRVMKAGVAERKFLGDALLKLVAAVDAKRYFEMLRHVSNGQLYINMYHRSRAYRHSPRQSGRLCESQLKQGRGRCRTF